MYKKFILFFSIISGLSGTFSNFITINKICIINDNKIKQYNTKYSNVIMNIDKICHKNVEFINNLPQEFRDNLVKSSSSIIPKFDSIGSIVLHLNEKFIKLIVESNLDINTKKIFILNIIQSAQNGDQMGSKILQFYYDFINCLL
jgi:hypothetical protein|tara:strand:+ start:23603 stop:24037 length:435 start_codon:yes stop_codon:yes gene_type:complete